MSKNNGAITPPKSKPLLVNANLTGGLAEDRGYMASGILGTQEAAIAILSQGDALLPVIKSGVDFAAEMLTSKAMGGLPADKVSYWFGQTSAPTSDSAILRGYVLKGLFEYLRNNKGVEDEMAAKVLAAWIAIIVSENLDVQGAVTALVEDVITWGEYQAQKAQED